MSKVDIRIRLGDGRVIEAELVKINKKTIWVAMPGGKHVKLPKERLV